MAGLGGMKPKPNLCTMHCEAGEAGQSPHTPFFWQEEFFLAVEDFFLALKGASLGDGMMQAK